MFGMVSCPWIEFPLLSMMTLDEFLQVDALIAPRIAKISATRTAQSPIGLLDI